jgi:hypothetical protein
MGNSGSPSFSEERGLRDCVVVERKGVKIVVASGNGFSAFNHITPLMKRKGKNIWKLKKGADIPPELRLVKDLRRTHEGHYMLAPRADMPFQRYLQLLEAWGGDPLRAVKLSPQEIQNG